MLGELCTAKGQKLVRNLLSKNGKVHGVITIKAEEVTPCQDTVSLTFWGKGLAKKG